MRDRLSAPERVVRTHGQPMGRFTFYRRNRSNSRDYLPHPQGEADGFIYKSAFFVLIRPESHSFIQGLPR